MARITGSASERVFQIQRWLGLNENPDGDTKLKMGEGAVMRNFKVTRDGNLQKRPGTKIWQTVVAGEAVEAVLVDHDDILVICDQTLYRLYWNSDTLTKASIIDFTASDGPGTDRPHMFAFGGKVYILTGHKYYCYDRDATPSCYEVEGYVPIVAVAVTPSGGGETLEQINKLTAKRKVWLSPDGTATTFQLPEKDLASIDSAVLTSDGTTAVSIASTDKDAGTITFTAAPTAGPSTIEVQYTAKTDFRSEVEAMHFSEMFNGSQDTRVFLYGDGSNVAIYSDIDHDGQQNAEYFPDQNVVRVGEENTPITSLIRHYSALIAFKSNSTYSIQYGNITLATGDIIPAFYVTPINRIIGCEAPGQAQLVLNNAVTLFGQDCYEWRNTSRYGTVLTRDERQAKRISDRVYATLHGFDTANCITFDDNYQQEYYICSPDGKALVYGYAADAWYFYTDFPMLVPFSYENELYYGASDGCIYHVSNRYFFDEQPSETEDPVYNAIDCYWESGSMSFGSDYQRKNSAMLWIGIKPEARAVIDVTALTDKEATYAVKDVKYEMFDFEHIDFGNEEMDDTKPTEFTFATNNKPQMRRLKIKPKKFVFYKLIFKTNHNNSSVTVTSADIRVRFMGYAK